MKSEEQRLQGCLASVLSRSTASYPLSKTNAVKMQQDPQFSISTDVDDRMTFGNDHLTLEASWSQNRAETKKGFLGMAPQDQIYEVISQSLSISLVLPDPPGLWN